MKSFFYLLFTAIVTYHRQGKIVMAIKRVNKQVILLFMSLVFFSMTQDLFAQDVVELSDGSSLSCSVLEINDETVIVKQKDVSDKVKLSLQDIISITYANGEKDVFKKAETIDNAQTQKTEKNIIDNTTLRVRDDNTSSWQSSPLAIESDEGALKRWNLIFRLGPAFYKKPDNFKGYNSSMSFEFLAGAKYNISKMLCLNLAAGWWSSNSYTRLNNENCDSESNSIIMPVEIGGYYPLAKKCGLIFEVGPNFTYGINGKVYVNGKKKTWKEMEDNGQNIDRFFCFLRVSGGINLWEYRLQVYIGIPLTKDNMKSKANNFWGITLGCCL